jgi:hypothetical protein
MYIDEVGNHHLRSHAAPNNRYLSLTGVIISRDDDLSILGPRLADIKARHFGDVNVVLHRKDIMNCRDAFQVLTDPKKRDAFDADLLDLVELLPYTVITCVIDKTAHVEKYQWQYHPYHYCLEILTERFVRELERCDGIGDMVVEARGKKEDKLLKHIYDAFYTEGTGIPEGSHLSATRIQRRLTSKELKIDPKSANVAGLQFADLLAHPSFKGLLANKRGTPMSPFGAEIVRHLVATKYRRSGYGQIEGYGTKWLP